MLHALVLSLLAQLPIAKQPDPKVMSTALTEARAKRPMDSKALLAIKQGPIDASLAKDLLEQDWLLAGAWSFAQKSFSPGYQEAEPTQFNLDRHLEDGRGLNFLFVMNQVQHTNFDVAPAWSVGLKTVGKDTYLAITTSGSTELHRVVQYTNGVLLLDLSADGKARSKRLDYRQVRIAVPRQFESTGK